MSSDPQADFNTVHYLWNGVLTVGGVIVAFFMKKTMDTIDSKADREDVQELRKDIREFLARNDQQHASNTKRLDDIIMAVRRNP